MWYYINLYFVIFKGCIWVEVFFFDVVNIFLGMFICVDWVDSVILENEGRVVYWVIIRMELVFVIMVSLYVFV